MVERDTGPTFGGSMTGGTPTRPRVRVGSFIEVMFSGSTHPLIISRSAGAEAQELRRYCLFALISVAHGLSEQRAAYTRLIDFVLFSKLTPTVVVREYARGTLLNIAFIPSLSESAVESYLLHLKIRVVREAQKMDKFEMCFYGTHSRWIGVLHVLLAEYGVPVILVDPPKAVIERAGYNDISLR